MIKMVNISTYFCLRKLTNFNLLFLMIEELEMMTKIFFFFHLQLFFCWWQNLIPNAELFTINSDDGHDGFLLGQVSQQINFFFFIQTVCDNLPTCLISTIKFGCHMSPKHRAIDYLFIEQRLSLILSYPGCYHASSTDFPQRSCFIDSSESQPHYHKSFALAVLYWFNLSHLCIQ